MGDNSDDELASDWVPYGEREDWADVRPLAQDDGDKPIVQIAYSDKCKLESKTRQSRQKYTFFVSF